MISGLKIWWTWDCYLFHAGTRGNVKNLPSAHNVDLDTDVVGSCLRDSELGCERGGSPEQRGANNAAAAAGAPCAGELMACVRGSLHEVARGAM